MNRNDDVVSKEWRTVTLAEENHGDIKWSYGAVFLARNEIHKKVTEMKEGSKNDRR
jgi:hypothetical protein